MTAAKRTPDRDRFWLGVKVHLSLWLSAAMVFVLGAGNSLFPGRFHWRVALLVPLAAVVVGLWRSRRTERLAALALHASSFAVLALVGIEVLGSRVSPPVVEVTRFPYPYRMHGFAPNQRPESNVFGATTNDTGLRASERIPRKPVGELRVLVIGGSTVLGVGSPDDKTPPALLESLLRERLRETPLPGVDRVRVINGGQGWYTSTQELIYFVTELALYEPDLVLVVDGYNDAHHATAWGYPPPLNAVLAASLGGTFTNPGLLHDRPSWSQGLNVLSSASTTLRKLGVSPSTLFATDSAYSPHLPSASEVTAKHQAEMRHRLLMNWTLLHRMATSLGLPVRFGLQPVIYRKSRSDQEQTWLATQSYADLMTESWEGLASFLDAETTRLGIPTFDTQRYLRDPPETLFTDYCHLTPEGNLLLARAMSEEVLSALSSWPWRVAWEGIRYPFDQGDPFWRGGAPKAEVWR